MVWADYINISIQKAHLHTTSIRMALTSVIHIQHKVWQCYCAVQCFNKLSTVYRNCYCSNHNWFLGSQLCSWSLVNRPECCTSKHQCSTLLWRFSAPGANADIWPTQVLWPICSRELMQLIIDCLIAFKRPQWYICCSMRESNYQNILQLDEQHTHLFEIQHIRIFHFG